MASTITKTRTAKESLSLDELRHVLAAPDAAVDQATRELNELRVRSRQITEKVAEYPGVGNQTLREKRAFEDLMIEQEELTPQIRTAEQRLLAEHKRMHEERRPIGERALRDAVVELDAALEVAAAKSEQVRHIREVIWQSTPTKIRGPHFVAQGGHAEQPYYN
ncbi:MAG: hypothetical protein LC753_11065, partial [Acidobacteria bacterium]|nr:hypothetical protein [Acidobacteriota bacterium]MCA1650784.1 hypothetical protein [Acidobacteriota bacterium]